MRTESESDWDLQVSLIPGMKVSMCVYVYMCVCKKEREHAWGVQRLITTSVRSGGGGKFSFPYSLRPSGKGGWYFGKYENGSVGRQRR